MAVDITINGSALQITRADGTKVFIPKGQGSQRNKDGVIFVRDNIYKDIEQEEYLGSYENITISTVAATSFDQVVDFLAAFFNAGGGAGGAVTSVFTRTGDVVAAVGDYAASQVTNDSSVPGAQVNNAIDNLAFNEYAESEAESQTTLSSYQPKLQHTTAVLPAGNYRINWSGEFTNSNKDDCTMVEVNLDSGTILGEFCRPKSKSDNDYASFSGFKNIALTNIAHTIDINYLAVANTAKIRRVRLSIKRIF